jgi:hypothetical protein
MRNDLHDLLQESLEKIDPSMNYTEFRELGGLLALAARLKDKKSGEIAASFMAGNGDERLSTRFLAIFDKDGLYDKIGILMYRSIDMALPTKNIDLFEAGITLAMRTCEAATLLSAVARRSASKAKSLAPGIISHCYKESDLDTLVYIIRLLREVCWAKDNNKSLKGVQDMFIKEHREFREFVAHALEKVFPGYSGKLYAIELREGRPTSSVSRNRATPGIFNWQRDAA